MKKIILISLFFIFGNIYLYSELLENVYAEYNCTYGVKSTLVTDSNSDGVYDTYTITWCDDNQSSYPIVAIGDIERWPPRGIPSRDITFANQLSGTFTEEYYNATGSNLHSWFTKPAGIDTVYFYTSNEVEMNFTAVSENLDLMELNLYPNPTSDYVNISYVLKSSKSVKIYIYDEVGIQVAEIDNKLQSPGAYNLNIPILNLNSGNYLVVVRFDLETVLTRKLTVVR